MRRASGVTHLQDVSEVLGDGAQDDLVRRDGRPVRAGESHINEVLEKNTLISRKIY